METDKNGCILSAPEKRQKGQYERETEKILCAGIVLMAYERQKSSPGTAGG